jgi:glutathione S-transferase
MQLIGMLDSPYVRRVAVSLQMLELPFTHRSISVFSTYAQFREINPLVKAPTLISDDGTQLIDSSLILDYAETLAAPGKSLMPAAAAERLAALRVIGLALAACEKSVQIAYERNLRPADKFYEPWVARVTEQLFAAYGALEAEYGRRGPARVQDQADVTAAIAWYFTLHMLPDLIDASRYPHLQALSAHAETLPAFRAAPYGASTYPVR